MSWSRNDATGTSKLNKDLATHSHPGPFNDSGGFENYLNEIIHEWLHTLTPIAFILVPLFFFLDYYTMPTELLQRIGIYRLISTLIIIVQYVIIRKTKPSKYSYIHAYIVSLNIGGIIAQMTVDLGGFDSRYYAGLILVIMGVNLLMPWKAFHTAVNSVVIIGLYVFLNLAAGQDYTTLILVNNLFFLVSTAVLAASINHVRHRLVEKEYHLLDELQEARDALWSEMELAKRIQTALLPDRKRIKGFEIAAAMHPAKEVGGDYYDIITTQFDGQWVTIGDVSGHGVDSGLIMMMAETSIISMVNSMTGAKPSEVIDSVNLVMRENISRLGSDHYMTLMALRINGTEMTVAGKHQDLIVYRSKRNQTEVIPTNGTWLGISDNIGQYLEDLTVKFEPGDIVLLFTDGITEATSHQGEMFGQERLEHLLNNFADLSVGKLLKRIIREVEMFQFEQMDDMTLIVMKKLPD